jgi:hypothetical protein
MGAMNNKGRHTMNISIHTTIKLGLLAAVVAFAPACGSLEQADLEGAEEIVTEEIELEAGKADHTISEYSKIAGNYSIVGATRDDQLKVLSILELRTDKTYTSAPLCLTCMIVPENGTYKLTKSGAKRYLQLKTVRGVGRESRFVTTHYEYKLSGRRLQLRKTYTSKWFTMEREVVCPQIELLPPGWCSDGTIVPGGTDSNGCQRSSRCEPRTDCRTSGCPSGRYCTFCWTGFACIPEGAMC